MFKILIAILYIAELLSQYCICLSLIDLPTSTNKENQQNQKYKKETNLVMYEKLNQTNNRRYWLVNDKKDDHIYLKSGSKYEDEKDANLKNKILILVEQTMHDSERRMKNVEDLKNENRDLPPYRAGFVLSLIKKSRDVMNELFNVAVKHRNDWKALEQLKIFELIMHTNVDTTNLVKQLIDIHMNHLNETSPPEEKKVLLI